MPKLTSRPAVLALQGGFAAHAAMLRALELLDATVERNAYGRQTESFEAEVETELGVLRSIFIRAPLIREVGPGVEVLGRHEGEIVLVRQGNILVANNQTGSMAVYDARDGLYTTMPGVRTDIFTVAEREALRRGVIELARADARLTAAADVGSRATGQADRYSDIDLSFTPAADFGALGPQFRLIYGQANSRPPVPIADARELFGWAVHHALRARFCIERGKYWQAEYWISGLRDDALSIACLQAGLPAAHGRGFDQLSPELLGSFEQALPRSLDEVEMLRALKSAIDCLLAVAHVPATAELATRIAPQLLALTNPFDNAA